MKNRIRDFFYFPKYDRRVVLALGCIAIFCIGVFVIADALREGRKTAVSAVTDGGSAHRETEVYEVGKQKDNDLAVEPFDPNTVDSLTLVRLGIKSWKIKNFLRFRAAGKVFRSAEDVGGTYGWTADDVELLAPYVRVANTYLDKKQYAAGNAEHELKGMETVTNDGSKFRTLTKVDANSADSVTLCRIPGIGRGISSDILRYRTRLGGFYSTRQLLEISTFSPELLEWFTVSDTASLTMLPINSASFQSLNSHPYITYDQTRKLLKYIRIYGDVEDEQTLLSTGIFTAEDIEKLRHYVRY